MNEITNFLPGVSILNGVGADWLGILLIAALAFLLGFGLNRGSVCTVIATTEWVSRKRPASSIALLESGIWAALIYAVLDASTFMPKGWLPLEYLIPGVLLFALGSYVSGACVFGSIGHIGNGDVEFSLVFVGIFIATYVDSLTQLFPAQPPLSTPLPAGIVPFLVLLVALLAVRFFLTKRQDANFPLLALSMGLVGVSFAMLVSLAPQFSITASIASVVTLPVAGAVAILSMPLGSFASSLLRERSLRLKAPTWNGILRHLTGGLLMGAGAVLIPGGNDTLLLVGFPGAAWQALVAYTALVVILAALIAGFGSSARAWTR
ncbi:YeeE/YedE thiosulfate transporter family protein [Hyphomicrobium sp.]|uniref:YeeE/YedE thiosulfate transporter family protein n=1 Tax=Hyphomicrobium sp. TaxID=82 RepID=UPI002FE4180C